MRGVDSRSTAETFNELEATVDRNIVIATPAHLLTRMTDVGFMEIAEVQAAVLDVQQRNGDVPESAMEFARAVFLIVTGKVSSARAISNRLVNNPSDESFVLGQDGVLIDSVGEGAFAQVFKAHMLGHHGNKGEFAVKVAFPFSNDNERMRFEREGAISARHKASSSTLTDANYVLAKHAEVGEYELPDDDGEMELRQCLVMEFLTGRTLGEIAKEVQRTGKPIDPQVATDLLILLLMKIRHFKGGAHRDIKPDNIMILDDKGRVRLLDPGLAKGSISDVSCTMTRDGGIGSAQFMPLEQFLVGKDSDRISDLHAIAATVYHLATGRFPREGDEHMEIYNSHMQGDEPTFSMVSQSSQVEGGGEAGSTTPDFDNLETEAPELARHLKQMLSIKREERLVDDFSSKLIPDKRDKTGKSMVLDISEAEIDEQLDRWIGKLMKHSKLSPQELIKDPGIFNSVDVDVVDGPEQDPDDIIGSMFTTSEFHRILTTPKEEVVSARLAKAARIQGTRSRTRALVVAALLAAGVVITGAIAMFPGKKGNGTGKPDKPVMEVVERPPKFRSYPGSQKRVYIPYKRGLDYKEINNDCLVFINSEFADVDDESWATTKRNDGKFVGILFNKYHGDEDGGFWEASYRNGDSFEGEDGSAAVCVPLANTEKYRTEIGSDETEPNNDTHMNQVRVGDYVLVVVNGEHEAVLYDIGPSSDGKSVVFPTTQDCVKYLCTIPYGDGTLFDAFSNLSFDTSKRYTEHRNRRQPGYDCLGREELSGSEHDKAVSGLVDNVSSYLNQSADQRGTSHVIAGRE